MENRLVSLLLKVGMAVLFIIGISLIWRNLSLAPSSDEDISLTEQSFFVIEHKQKSETGKKVAPEKEVLYSYVVNTEKNEVYDLELEKIYEYAVFNSSKGEEKVLKKTDEFPNGTFSLSNTETSPVNYLLLKNYKFQSATYASISFTQWLLIIAGIVILLFTVWNIAINPKRFVRSAIGFVALIVIAFICYKMAPEAGTGKMLETSNYTDENYRYTGAGIMITGSLIVISVGLIVYQSVVNFVRYFSK